MKDEEKEKSSNQTNEVIDKYISRTLPTAKIINNRFATIEEKNENNQKQNKEGIDYES